LHVSFRNKATDYRALLRKMTCKDKSFYASSPSGTSYLAIQPCTKALECSHPIKPAILPYVMYIQVINRMAKMHSHCSAAFSPSCTLHMATTPYNIAMQYSNPMKPSTQCIHTGKRRCIGCLQLQVSFRKKATDYRALLRKMAI